MLKTGFIFQTMSAVLLIICTDTKYFVYSNIKRCQANAKNVYTFRVKCSWLAELGCTHILELRAQEHGFAPAKSPRVQLRAQEHSSEPRAWLRAQAHGSEPKRTAPNQGERGGGGGSHAYSPRYS